MSKCKNCEANIMHYELTYRDFALFKKLGKQQKTILAKTDLSNAVVFKKWGFEYMIYEDKDCCGWFLHIEKHSGTSLHCHETKTTVVCVVSGMLLLTTATRRQLMESGDMAIIDKKVFHAMGAASEDTRVIELEMPSYKPDAIRAVDYWGRVGQPYESKCLIMKAEKYISMSGKSPVKLKEVSKQEQDKLIQDALEILQKPTEKAKAAMKNMGITYELQNPPENMKKRDKEKR